MHLNVRNRGLVVDFGIVQAHFTPRCLGCSPRSGLILASYLLQPGLLLAEGHWILNTELGLRLAVFLRHVAILL